MATLLDTETYITAPTYESLTALILIYLNRDDDATKNMVPFFINASEKAILRELRIPSLEKLVVVDTENVEYGWIELPLDYVEMRYVWTDGDDKQGTLQRVPFDQILRGAPIGGGSSTTLVDAQESNLTTEGTYYPQSGDYNTGYWAINANRLYFCGVEKGAELKMTYYYDVPELGTENQSNPILDLLPDAMLYMAVSEGWKFLMEPERSSMWEEFAGSRIRQAQAQSDAAEFAGSPLTINPV